MAVGKDWGNRSLLLTGAVDKAGEKGKPSPILYANGIEAIDDVVYITDADAWPPLPPIQPGGPWDSLTAYGLNVFTVCFMLLLFCPTVCVTVVVLSCGNVS